MKTINDINNLFNKAFANSETFRTAENTSDIDYETRNIICKYLPDEISRFLMNKIETPHLIGFIRERFSDTGKEIDDEACRLLIQLADNHPYNVRQLAQLSWLRTMKKCTEDIVEEAHHSLVEQLSLLFVTITETLTTQQLNYLKALTAGEKAISSMEVMYRYRISSPSAVARSRKTLIEKDILDNKAGAISFQDPIYAYWLKHTYFAE